MTSSVREPEGEAQPVYVLDLFPPERAALLDLLAGLTPREWALPTVCAGWSVKDVALHILGGDLSNISRRRDGVRIASNPGEDLVAAVNRFNDEWVRTARRLSTRLIIDLLTFSGPQLFDYFASLDLAAPGGPVSWAGAGPAPVWLDVAREYTERWLHQQHIRDAVGKPGLTDRRFMAPVLATFVHALPVTYQHVDAPSGTALHLHIAGEAGGDWALRREGKDWTLYSGTPASADAVVEIDQSVAWKLFTKGLTPEQALNSVHLKGDRRLAERLLEAVAIIA